MKYKKIAFLFPGQGAQYPGMAKDFYDAFPVAKQTFEEADDLLGFKLSNIIFNGPDQLLTETKNSQLGIYVASIAIRRTLQNLFPEVNPSYTAGLSLGEYTALTAANKINLIDGLTLVGFRGQFMNDACEATKGTMAVILGLSAEQVEQMVDEVNLHDDLWAANFNCPGQVVISGTLKGIEAGTQAALKKGAKRVLPLQVHGAFHSGLMKPAEQRLAPYVEDAAIRESPCHIVMNVPGATVKNLLEIRQYLIEQVTQPVRWEQGIRHMMQEGIDLYIEMGCGKTLAGFNKRIGVSAPTISIEKTTDIASLENVLKETAHEAT